MRVLNLLLIVVISISRHATHPSDEQQRRTYNSYPINLTSLHRDLGVITGDEHPFVDIKGYMPVDVNDIDMHWIYSDFREANSNHTIRFDRTFDEQVAALPHYDQAFIITHGFTSSPERFVAMKSPLLAIREYNGRSVSRVAVFFTDWSAGARSFRGHGDSLSECLLDLLCYYHQPAVTTGLVGRQLGLFIFSLTARYKKVRLQNVHLIGSSLGAHVSHYASLWNSQLRSEYGRVAVKVGRITALDPAAPDFQPHPGSYITKGDAKFIDVIHSSPGNGTLVEIYSQRYGMSEAIGDVDIYVNSGAPQPQCVGNSPGSACSHFLAHRLWSFSLIHNGRNLESVPCVWPQGPEGQDNSTAMQQRQRSVVGLDAIKRRARGVQCLIFVDDLEGLDSESREFDSTIHTTLYNKSL